MLEISVKDTIAEGLKRFYALEPRQFPFIVALAMNRTMKRLKDDLRGEMQSAFDRPVPFTLNSLQTKAATKQDLSAFIKLKDGAGKGVPASKYLAPEVYGGPRKHKRFEKALIAAHAMPSDLYAVPSEFYKGRLDSYGNIRGSFIVQILSALSASPDPYQNQTDRSRKRRKPKYQFYAITKPDNPRGLPLGIYQQFPNGQSRMIIAYVRQPVYKERFKFYQVSQDKANIYLKEELAKAAEQAIATSNTSLTLSSFTDILDAT